MLGGRSSSLVARSIFEPAQYRAFVRMVRRYPQFPEVAKRYLFGGGDYPYACHIRTPMGEVQALTYSHHDIFTVQEVFGREDYRAGPDLTVVVDIGSNIGISALYFLTRNATSRCYLYEPVPRNVERLRENLVGYRERYEVEQVAVAPTEGTVDFTVEPSGRYGGIGIVGSERIQVRCRSVAEVLDEVLDREGQISLLKLDIEGAELETVRAIPAAQRRRVRTICFESETPNNPDPGRFTMRFAAQTVRLDRLEH
jgi:FkbM family methyltransferase